MRRSTWMCPVLFLVAQVAASSAVAQDPIHPLDDEDNPPSFTLQRGWRSGTFEGSGEETFIAATTMIGESDAPWMRLHFGERSLGQGSYIRIRGVDQAEAVQDLDARSLQWWYDYSAFFLGDAVLVELHVAPEDQGAFIEIDSIIVGNPLYVSTWDVQGGADDLCGADNRVGSNEKRVGRVARLDGVRLCSPWLASNGAMLMAAHCVDFDNNGTNERITAGSVVEFNPPASTIAGVPNPSLPQDQYPIDLTSLNYAVGYAVGSDWSLFGLNPNATNLDRAHTTRGFFRMTREAPTTGAGTIRVTGCGDDQTPTGLGGGLNAQSRTVQTNAGPNVQESSNGALFWHLYQVDTTNGVSGAPIIWTDEDVTIGIHTNAGCTTGAGNQGVSFEHNNLEIALRNFVDQNARFVDVGMPDLDVTEDGTVFRPYDRVPEAATAVPSGGVVSLVAGSYTHPNGNSFTTTKAMTLEAPAGPVIIGNPTPGADICWDMVAISGFGTFEFDNYNAETDGSGSTPCDFFGQNNIENDVWFRWTPTANGDVTISTCGLTTVDTKVAVYIGDNCYSSAPIACNDDACGRQSEVTFNAVSPIPYLIRIGNYPGAMQGQGMFTIALDP